MSMQPLVPEKPPRGQVVVEALLVVAILVFVILGGIELSRGVAIRQALDSSTAAAVRALSLDPSQWSHAEEIIQQAASENVLGGLVVTNLQVFDASGNERSPAWLSGSSFGTTFILQASAPFQAEIPFLSESILTIRVQHWGIVERYP